MPLVKEAPATATATATARTRHHGRPTHGFTSLGQAVHRRTVDHMPSGTAYQRLNKKIAVAITSSVGTMTSAYIFTLLALVSLPAVLTGVSPSTFKPIFPHWLVALSLINLVAWIAQTFLQLVLLPVIIVGQNVQSEAADVRAAKTFEDVEDARNSINSALNLLDIHTEGGLKTVLDAIEELKAAITAASGTTQEASPAT